MGKTEVLTFRKAKAEDLEAIAAIYAAIHTAEEKGEAVIGWQRGVYPEWNTAEAALERGDLFVEEADGRIVGTAILNHIQVPEYAGAPWRYPANDDQVMVMHTLVIDPTIKGKGYGRAFAKYYEEYALENDSPYLRIDTNERNAAARSFYKKLGYEEIGITPCVFNGIEGVGLVMLEKKLG